MIAAIKDLTGPSPQQVARYLDACGVLGPSKDTFTSGNVIKELLLNTETIMADLSVS